MGPIMTDSPDQALVDSPWVPPTSLSPSRVESFLSCPLAFRFSSIERLPDPPSVATTRGSLVHRALELLFLNPPAERTATALDHAVEVAIAEYREHPDFTLLGLDAAATAAFDAECRDLATGYLTMEDPTAVRDIGLELRLEAPVGALTLRGIIDRLELDGDGELVVTDYKTGRVPSEFFEAKSLGGVHIYALLCQQMLGRRPAKVQLLYLSKPEAIIATPTEQTCRGVERRTSALWTAIEGACEREDFRAKPSRLCDFCSFKPYCPAHGGDPDRAVELRGTLADAVASEPALRTA